MAPEQLECRDLDARSDIWFARLRPLRDDHGHASVTGESQASVIAAILHKEPASVNERPGARADAARSQVRPGVPLQGSRGALAGAQTSSGCCAGLTTGPETATSGLVTGRASAPGACDHSVGHCRGCCCRRRGGHGGPAATAGRADRRVRSPCCHHPGVRADLHDRAVARRPVPRHDRTRADNAGGCGCGRLDTLDPQLLPVTRAPSTPSGRPKPIDSVSSPEGKLKRVEVFRRTATALAWSSARAAARGNQNDVIVVGVGGGELYRTRRSGGASRTAHHADAERQETGHRLARIHADGRHVLFHGAQQPGFPTDDSRLPSEPG